MVNINIQDTLKYLLVLGLFYGMAYSTWFIRRLLEPLSEFITIIAYTILNIFQGEVALDGNIIRGHNFSMEIMHLCTGMDYFIPLMAGILIIPAILKKKIFGIVLAFVSIQMINLARIISIFYTGSYYRNKLVFYHEIFWEIVMVLSIFAIWFLWIFWQNPGNRAC